MANTLGYFCYIGDFSDDDKCLDALISELKEQERTHNYGYPDCVRGEGNYLAFLYSMCTRMFDKTNKYLDETNITKCIAFLEDIKKIYENSIC